MGVSGFVRNTTGGVEIEAESDAATIERFTECLILEAPPLAWIQEKEFTELKPSGNGDFTIEHSVAKSEEFALISPDVATCPECLADIANPSDRRHDYAFTNCTNCGPRYTIVRDIPYDRPKTTMAPFRMCPACQAEYDDPSNRRFHAQPNACPACGPALSAPIEEARRRLAAGVRAEAPSRPLRT